MMITSRALTTFVLLFAFLALPGAMTAGVCSDASAAHEHGTPDHSGHAPENGAGTDTGCQASAVTGCGIAALMPASQEREVAVASISVDLRPELRIPATAPSTTVFHPPRI